MHWYHLALLVGAIVAAGLAWQLPRAVLWIALGAVSFVASSLWHDSGAPYGAAFGASANLAVCFALYANAEQRWELRVWNCFHLMILIEILYLSGWIKSHYNFAVALEACNWLALLIIGGAGVAERSGYGPDRLRIGRLGASWTGFVNRSLFAKRTARPFWEIPG